MTRRLIVTADDFGAALPVNKAVESGYRDGVLTAASLMVGAPGVADAVARARRLTGLCVGLHLVLVEGRPVLPPSAVSLLVGPDGCFRTDMARAGATMFFHPLARRQLAAEITAQFQAFADTGLPLDHVNTHKHFHLHPTICGLILSSGQRFGMTAARAPVEPRATIAAVESGGVRHGLMFDAMARLARRRLRRAGMTVPDQVFGLRWSGAVTTARLRGLIENLPEGLTEIYLHPALHVDFPGAAPGYRYAEELAALTAPEVVEAVARRHLVLGGFRDFAADPKEKTAA